MKRADINCSVIRGGWMRRLTEAPFTKLADGRRKRDDLFELSWGGGIARKKTHPRRF